MPSRFARLWLIVGLAGAVAVVCWPSSVFLAGKWVDTVNLGYTHGWLTLGLCLALMWRSRSELAAAAARPSPWAWALLIAAMLAWLVSYRASVESLEIPLVPVVFLLSVAASLGWAVARVLLFPAGYFYFAVPVWHPAPLKFVTIHVVHGMLRLTGPRADFAGEVIRIPNGTFVVEDGCSGVHFMIVGLALAALYGELERDPWRTRAQQLALMAALAMLANWVRVYTIIEAGYLTNMQSYLVRVSHYGFGWCVFAVALVAFFWLAPRLGQRALAQTEHAAPAAPQHYRPGPELLAAAGALAILVAVPVLNTLARAAHPPATTAAAGAIDPPAPWRMVTSAGDFAWLPRFPHADVWQRVVFGDGSGRTVEVLLVAYRVQRDGEELVGEDSSLFGDALEVRAEQLVNSSAGRYRETEVVDRTQGRSLIWWRYEVAGRPLVVPFAEQLWYGINALVWCPPARLIALRSACGSDCAGARRTLSAFVAGGGAG
jgi:exosortase